MSTTQQPLCTIDNCRTAHINYYAYIITTEQLLMCTFEDYKAAIAMHISHSNCMILLRIILKILQ